jgi:hypothetical protein
VYDRDPMLFAKRPEGLAVVSEAIAIYSLHGIRLTDRDANVMVDH